MGIRVELQMLAVLLLLSPVVIDGVVLTKCQLVNDLNATVPANMTNRTTFIAKLVRQAELVTNFSTNFTMQVNSPLNQGKNRDTRSVMQNQTAVNTTVTTKPTTKATTKHTTKPTTKPTTKRTTKATTTSHPKNATNPPAADPNTNMTMMNQTAPPQNGSNNSSSDDQMAPPYNSSQMWTLYGLFMIPDVVACTSPNVTSSNICNMPCSQLVSDDITNATKCMLTILNNNCTSNSPSAQQGVSGVINQLTSMFMQAYSDLNSTQYLSECVGQ